MTNFIKKLFRNAVLGLVGFAGLSDNLKVYGIWTFEHYRNGELIQTKTFKNLVTNAGKNDILSVYFRSGTQTATANWYIGLISDTSFTGIDATDTAGSHAGWTEFTTYSQATRPLWGQGAVSSQVITNASPAVFSINGGGVVKGFFIINSNTKGGTSGTLWNAATYPSGDTNVINGDEIRATYSLSL